MNEVESVEPDEEVIFADEAFAELEVAAALEVGFVELTVAELDVSLAVDVFGAVP